LKTLLFSPLLQKPQEEREKAEQDHEMVFLFGHYFYLVKSDDAQLNMSYYFS
jgi:hypothetical protein